MPVKTIIKTRRDTAANWTSTNPTLAAGEAGLETDTKLVKYGDGTTAWNSLGYANVAKLNNIANTALDADGSIADNEILGWNSATSKWTNQTAAELNLLTTTSTTVPTATNAAAASGFGFIGLPQVSTATGLNLTAAHAGRHIYTTATGQTHTIPSDATANLEIGTTIVFINNGAITTSITTGSPATLTLAGTTTSTNPRTLGTNGMATAVKTAANTWVISGNGLT